MPAKLSPLEELNQILKKEKVEASASTLGFDQSLSSKVKTFLPSGILTLDVILGSGWPMGRMVEVFGHEASGKSMLAAMACAQAQKAGYLAVYLDTEFAVDQEFFAKLGMDLDSIYYINPQRLTDVFTILEAMFEFKAKHFGKDHPMIFVWDSIASTTNADVMKKSWEEKGYSTAAIYISQALQKLVGDFGPNNTLFFMINQTRTNVGVQYGPADTTYGGKAKNFYSSVRMDLKVVGHDKIGEKGEWKRTVAMDIRAEVIKNKVVAPYRAALIPMHFVEGYIDEVESVITMLKDLGLVTVKPGGNYELPGLVDGNMKRADFPALIADYRQELYDYLSEGWKKIPTKQSKNGASEDSDA